MIPKERTLFVRQRQVFSQSQVTEKWFRVREKLFPKIVDERLAHGFRGFLGLGYGSTWLFTQFVPEFRHQIQQPPSLCAAYIPKN
ncbi:MAG: hypothetical protein COS37_01495, partial [Anaerolineae bacterium CG03_land_8_20_14_0_80_58_20]